MQSRSNACWLPVGLALSIALQSCSGRDHVLETVGKPGYWHLERVAQRPVLSALSHLPVVSSLIGDSGERWWFVSPRGDRVFARMVSGVGVDEPGSLPAGYMEEAKRNLTAWGFNAFGYYLGEPSWFAAGPGRLPALLYAGGLNAWTGVFDDWVEQLVADTVGAQAAAVGNSTDVLGLHYGMDGGSSPRLLLLAHGSFPPDSGSKRKLVEVIKARCRNDPKQLWARMPDVKTFEDLIAKRQWDVYDGVDDDGTEFAKTLYARWGELVRKHLKAKLPNQLVLGPVLWPDTPIEVLRALAPHVDALSIFLATADGRLSRRYFEEAYRATGKPIVIWAQGPQLREGQGLAVETEAGQAISYRRMAGGAAALPFVAGFCWTKYRDRPGENVALLDQAGGRREQMLNLVTETNGQIDRVHAEGAHGYYPEYFQEDRFASGAPRQIVARTARPVKVDGDLADWPARGSWLENVKMARDLDPVVFCGARVAWDETGLLIAVEVQDDAVELLDPRAYWIASDFVEIFLDSSGKRLSRYGQSTTHLVLLPRGGGEDGASALAMVVHHEGDKWSTNQYNVTAIETASSFFRGQREFRQVSGVGRLTRVNRVSLSESSWKMEARIPWSVVGTEPKPGQRIRFNLIVHRMGKREEEAFWAAPRMPQNLASPAAWGQLTMAAEGAP